MNPAGEPDETALADYLGMDIDSLTVLHQAASCRCLRPCGDLAILKPALILAGRRRRKGECQRELPFCWRGG